MNHAHSSTVEKYMAFLHFLRFQLNEKAPKFKISVSMIEWKLNTNLPRVLIDKSIIMRTGHGKYEWVGPMPSLDMAKDTVKTINNLSKKAKPAPKPVALLSGPASATPIGAEIALLRSRVEELETIVLQLMEQAA